VSHAFLSVLLIHGHLQGEMSSGPRGGTHIQPVPTPHDHTLLEPKQLQVHFQDPVRPLTSQLSPGRWTTPLVSLRSGQEVAVHRVAQSPDDRTSVMIEGLPEASSPPQSSRTKKSKNSKFK
jgi:hypothetical protein